MKRQDQLLAHMDAYAVDRETNAMLLQYEGKTLSTSSKIVKSKLLAIDPTTRALLVKFGNQLPWQVLDPNPEFTTLKVGSKENYAYINSDGNLVLFGKAKRLLTFRPEINQDEVRKRGVPEAVQVGVFFGYSMPVYTAENLEELFFKQRVPYRWDGVYNPNARIKVALAGAEGVDDNFKFQLSWEHSADGDIVPATSNDVEVEQTVLAGRNAQYSSYELDFIIDYDIDGPGSEIVAGELLGARLRRITASAPEVANEIIVLDWVVEYRRDKLGAPWEE